MNHLHLSLCLGLFLPLAASALPIVVNPTTPLTGTYAVEWNGGNLESWAASGTSATVSGGVLSGTTSNSDPQITRTIPTNSRPDLDLGFNDFLELRMQVPANYADDIQIYYGTTATTSFSAGRLISIPNTIIPKDGAFHTYRIDVGPEPWWRESLRDLRVDPGNASGVAFAIDYLRVGDEPAPTVYQPRFTTQCPASGGATPGGAYFGPGQAVSSMESKHFRFIWNNNVTAQSGWNTNTARGTLRNLEEAWQVYVKILGYREPAYNVGTTSGTAYKLNVTSYFDGFWAGLDDHGGTSLAQLNITPGGLQVDPPTWVVPHELMHCFQFHNTSGNVNGEWFETHANYARERWLQHYQVLYPNRSNIEALGVRDGHFMMSSGRNYYLTWPFMYYVDTNPDNLPDIGEGMIKRVWQETQPGEFSMTALDRITPETSMKDLSGYYARRCATWDFSNQVAMTAELNTQDPASNARHLFTDLIQRPDAPTWWRVPANKAPAQGAYAMHELIPAGSGAGRVVTVNLQGLADSARGADWRASMIAVSDSGVERYTPLWNNGNSSITLAADENKLYLSVAGTPDVFHYGGHDEATFRFRSHPSRSRFHYEVQVTGATPRERTNGSTSGLTQHSNGNGWKSVSVPNSVFIGPNARVTGGTVSGNARIEDYAVVSGGTVNSNAVVSGNAWVRGGTVTGNARVRDWAIVDSGTISGNARVLEHATVGGDMQDTAVAKGSALHQGGGTLSGNAIVDGDYMFNKSISNGVTFGHLPFVGVPDSFTTATPAGLYAAYNFRNAHDSRALDQYGVTDAFTLGSPAWSSDDGERRGFLTFNGSNKFIALDRSVADSRAFSFSAWVKPTGGAANQALLWLGATPTRRLSLTASDGSGQAKFSIVNGGAEQTLVTNALPTDVWSHIAVTLNGSAGVLYVNGAATSGSITLSPDQLLAENTSTGTQHNYLARAEGSAMPMFQGSLDDAQFYSSALTAIQIGALATPPAPVGDLMLSDSFTAENYDVGSFNNNLATDQQGYYAPTAYSLVTGGQGWQAQHGNGGTMLLVGDGGYGSRASLNEDFALVGNEFDQALAFQVDAWVDTGNNDAWSSVVIGTGQNLNADSGAAKFAIRPMRNGSLQVWVNGSQMPLASRSGNTFRIILSDTEGSGSAFNGNGSEAALYNGATLVGTYTLPQLGPGDGYITFGAQPNNGYTLTRIDNLNISRFTPPPPPPPAPTALTWQGDTDTDYNTGSNYLENSWAQWTDCIFNSNVANGTLNVDDFTGWGNLSLNSGLATDIVIGGSSPVIMAPAKLGQPGWDLPSVGGSMTLAPDSRNLTINTGLIIAGELVWDVGSGRTLTANGSFQNWTDNGTASLRKQGDGTAILAVSNSYSGGTTINAGTLIANRSGLGTGAVVINNGGTLYANDQWVLCGANPYNVPESNIGSLTINIGGTLQFDAIQGFANGATHLYLNGGLITGGPNDFRGDLFLYNGNQQITAGGATASTIATIIGVSGNNNTVTVGDGSTLNLTSGIKNSDWFSNGTSPGGFIKAGAGTLVLAANCSYSGTTNITGGTLQVGTGGSSGSLGSGDVSIASGANLTFNRGDTLTTSQNFSGDGSITKEGAGNLIINSEIASITDVVVNEGLIRTDFFRLWSSNLDLTVNGTGVFEMWNTTTTIANLSGNGTVRNTANWSGYAIGAPYATNNLTIAAGNFSGTITDNGFGDGSNTGTTGDTRIQLFKSTNATLTLSGTTSHTGNTTVQAGTLRLGNGSSPTNLADAADVIVAAGAMLHLDYTGTDTINALWVDGSQQSPGVYSSTSGFITGSGTLTVSTGPAPAGYATWSGSNGHNLSGGPSDDDDHDSVPNLIEYVLGGNPLAASHGILPIATTSAGNLVFTFRRILSTTVDTTQVFHYGTNLSGWTDVPLVAGGMVAIQPDTPQIGTDTVIITVPQGNEPGIFGRLKVSTAPAQP